MMPGYCRAPTDVAKVLDARTVRALLGDSDFELAVDERAYEEPALPAVLLQRGNILLSTQAAPALGHVCEGSA